jgi:multimeric flavodoxin WrbA
VKVVAFNGSARKDGNTATLLNRALAEINAAGIETELIQLAGKVIRPCQACYRCAALKNKRCGVTDDFLNDCVAAMDAADGIILGSPTYFADVSGITKALIERAGLVSRVNGDMLKRKVGAAVVSVRRGGAIHAFDTANHFFLIGQMIVVGSIYWNIGIGRDKGDVEGDEEGMATMKSLGENMAWLLPRVRG